MWNRSYKWQRQVRLAGGISLLVAAATALLLLARTPGAHRVRDGASDLLGELDGSGLQALDVQVPASLHTRVGTLVYRERADGVSQVIGRVVNVQPGDPNQEQLAIRLSAAKAGRSTDYSVLKGAPASLGFRDAMRVLISPSTPMEEALVARDLLWPSITNTVLPEVVDRLIAEISSDSADLSEEDAALLRQVIEKLHEEIAPFEDKLVDRLAKRAWDEVGMQGIAEGIWRTTTSTAREKSFGLGDWWARLLGSQADKPPEEQPFLSERTSHALRAALEQEALDFWKENRSQIIDVLVKAAASRRQEFEAAFRDRWSAALYERVILPAWQASQDKVIESLQSYVSNFASRHLLTSHGGPRLLFAFVLRSYLDISLSPLLILAPGDGHASQRVVFEPLLR